MSWLFVIFPFLILLTEVNGKPPHVVFMVVDDLGWNDVGFNNPDIISPNIDSLAHDGVILNHAYVQPLCSPSRSAFMTSYYPFRLGLQHMVINNEAPVCAPLDKTFLPQVLKKNGYATHIVGKWHLGFCRWECTPTYRGFDTYYGYYNSAEDYYIKVQAQGFDFHINEKINWDAVGNYSAYQYGDAVENVVRQHDPTAPLFLYFPIQSVHEPLEVPLHYYNMYPNITNDGRRIFSGMVTAADDVVGRLVKVLKDRDMFDDTIFFFTADNGGWVPYHGNNYPLRGGKITIWEGGTRVPAFVHGKPLQKTGVRYDGLMHAVDWFPTILEAAGINYSDPHRDGISQWQSITSLSASRRSEFVYNLDNYTTPNQGHAAIRVGDFKLIVGYPGLYNDWYKPEEDWPGPPPSSDYSDLDSQMDPHTYSNWTKFRGLYNIKDDPYEHNNLYDKLPEVVEKLKARMSHYYTMMVPANYPPNDPKADPNNFDLWWQPGWC
ncbi:arylsulfatase B [Aplysia californica]|uniref:Arylsulfatase B n=1 Tax=Aplysia californica TaxID=6500 RepID=A0ABM0JWH9_APLCA|nr:arylsulfatase B [Aplysia californica]